MSESIVAIGDIHGCARTLETLWNKLKPYKNSIHVFVGDYIDRGPSSRQVVDFLLEVRHDRNCVFLRGNHEAMLLDALHNNRRENWMYNGGDTTLRSYNHAKSAKDIPESHLQFYEETKLYYETENYFFVHAGVPPDQTIEKSLNNERSQDFFLWGRDHLNAFDVPWEKTVVFGHTPRSFPIQKKKMIGIDTGCVYNELGFGKLTAVLLPENTFIQQASLD
jgi:serine/threonine protein phosphatase 1